MIILNLLMLVSAVVTISSWQFLQVTIMCVFGSTVIILVSCSIWAMFKDLKSLELEIFTLQNDSWLFLLLKFDPSSFPEFLYQLWKLVCCWIVSELKLLKNRQIILLQYMPLSFDKKIVKDIYSKKTFHGPNFDWNYLMYGFWPVTNDS